MRRIACISILVLAVLGLGAQESGQGPDIGTVDVTAQVYSPLVLAPAGSVTVVTAAEIARSGASSAAEALEAVPGVTVNGRGAGGSQVNVSIGASSSSEVLVIIDGVKLNDPLNGAPDLNQVAASTIDKIEVLRGGASAAYGADALGGVIVITTKKSGERRLAFGFSDIAYPTATGLAGADSLVDGQKFTVDSGSRIGLADLAVSVQAERGANAYDYSSAGTTALRTNAGFWNAASSFSLGLPFADGRLAATAMASHQETGVPGSLAYGLTPDDRQLNTAFRGSLGWSDDSLAGGSLSLDLLAHGSYSTMDLSDPAYTNSFQISSAGLDLREVSLLAPFCSLAFGATVLNDAAAEPGLGRPSRLSLGAYVEPTLLAGDRLKVTPSLRYDWNTAYEAGPSAMLGAVYKASDSLRLRLSGGRSYMAPTFADLFWPVDTISMYKGNPNLRPETAYAGEFGADISSGSLAGSAAINARYVEDMINTYYPGSYLVMNTAVNIGRAFIPGADLVLRYAVGAATLTASYEFVYPLDLSGGASIADSPALTTYSRHSADASADFVFGRATAGLSAQYRSSHADAAQTTRTMPAVILFNLRGSVRVAQGTTLTLNIDNLFDEGYEVIYGYPMPGLTLKLGMRLDL